MEDELLAQYREYQESTPPEYEHDRDSAYSFAHWLVNVSGYKILAGEEAPRVWVRACSCGAKRGEYHDELCDLEICPLCGGQVGVCDCIYRELKLYDYVNNRAEHNFLSKEMYENGPSDEQWARFDEMIEKAGRVPYIDYPWLCQRCGAPAGPMWRVSKSTWTSYMDPRNSSKVLCKKCWLEIKVAMDEHGTVMTSKRSDLEPLSSLEHYKDNLVSLSRELTSFAMYQCFLVENGVLDSDLIKDIWKDVWGCSHSVLDSQVLTSLLYATIALRVAFKEEEP